MPRVTSKPFVHDGPASRYAGTHEVIKEFSDGNGNGGLVSLACLSDGTLRVEVYRTYGKVQTMLPNGKTYDHKPS